MRRLTSILRKAISAAMPSVQRVAKPVCMEELESRRLLSALTIAQENALPGTPMSTWFVSGTGDSTIQGYTTDISVNQGGTINFKINDQSLAAYHIDIYRIGYYQGDGARFITTISNGTKVNQPNAITNAATGEVDAGNWSVTASWTVPTDATSGVYLARVARNDTGGAFMMLFVVRNDASHSQIMYQTADATWEAYNEWGGNSLYLGTGPGTGSQPGRAYAVSYNRPVTDEGVPGGYGVTDYFFYAEFPTVEFLEQNGYDVTYSTDVDADRNGSLILNHKVLLAAGHDEYISGNERTNFQNAANAGVSLAFLSGNEMYWKTELDPSIDGSNTPDRTLTCYKDSIAGALINPSGVWTGLWRDMRFASPSEDVTPENALTGTLLSANRGPNDVGINMTVLGTEAAARFWRNTAVASLSASGSMTVGDDIVGYESDSDEDNGFRPAGLIDLSSTTNVASQVINAFGTDTFPETITQSMTEYKNASGAIIFGAGTVQWAWGLNAQHDGLDANGNPPPIDKNIQQATINLLADMGAVATTLMAGMVAATASTDKVAPTSVITSPGANLITEQGGYATVSGTSTDSGGGVVAGVEVSVDGGNTWHPVTSMSADAASVNWSYTWSAGSATSAPIEVRATDDSLNIETPKAALNATLSSNGTLTIFSPASVPLTPSAADPAAVELGVQFSPDVAGTILGIRFYKGTANTGTHVGNLWSSNGTLLATATFTNETASGWQQVNFSTPVTVQAGVTYTASYHTNTGNYADDVGFFDQSGYVNGSISALSGSDEAVSDNGVYAYGATSQFPTSTFESSNYWVDVVFAPAAGVVAPQVVAETPAPNALNVATNSNITVTFNEQVNANSISLVLTNPSGNTVATTLTYNSSTKTATLTPTSPLSASTRYMVTLNSVSDSSGDLLPQPMSWTFGTAANISGAPITIFAANSQPTTADANDAKAIEVGMKFESSVAGTILGVRFYKGTTNTGTHVGNLWSSSGQLLATATFTGESASGWQQVNFSTPVQIQANTVYIVSYHTNVGLYAADANYFASGVTDGPLTALSNAAAGGNGVFTYGASSLFPTTSSGSTNYWVDVVFTPGAPPAVTSINPVNQATGVNPASVITVTFNEALDASTVNTTTFKLLNSANTAVAATVSYNSTTNSVMITPTGGLATGSQYTVQVIGGSSGVKSSVGDVPLASTFTSTFATAANAVPVVSGVNPIGGATGVSTTAPLSVTFNEPMDINTIGSSTVELIDPNNKVVPAELTYVAATNSVSIAPDAPLLSGTTYTVQVVGGATGVMSSVGDVPLAATFSSTFTTLASNTVTLFPSAAVPVEVTDTDPNAVELGVEFQSSVAGTITGIRFYKGSANTGTHVGNLWSSTGQLLATATFTNETSSGWQQVNFSTPVAIQANTLYVASYHTAGGHYSADSGYFASSFTSGPLSAPVNAGVYAYGASSAFPSNTFGSTNYWVDVVFAPSTGAPPVVTTITPANGSAGVSATAAVSASFSEALDPATVNTSTIKLLDPSNNVITSTVTYNASTNSVILTPVAALLAGTTYTVQIVGGSSGVKSSGLDVALAANYSTSFQTATSTSSALSIFASTATPTFVNFSDPQAAELGIAFQSSVPGLITGIRFYKGSQNTGTHVGSLWSVQDDGFTLLATATFTNETASGWQQVNFSTPIAIQANTIYVAGYHTNVGFYSADPGYFQVNGVTNGPLTALASNAVDDPGGNGIFAYGPSQFPFQANNATNYWVDVVFTPSVTTPPTITTVSPVSGASGVSVNTNIIADFSEALDATTVTSATVQLLDPSNSVVAATISYNANTEAVTITPVSPLQAGTTYTVDIVGGANGIKSAAGDVAMTSTYTSAFTTVPAVSSTITIFPSSSIPGTVTTGDANATELGVKFESSVAGTISGIRFYKGPQNTGTHIGDLWSSTGQLLATATFTSESASGWQQVNFSTPVTIQANTIYVASYHTNVGFYSADPNYFATATTDGPLTALSSAVAGGNGVFSYSASSIFPTGTSGSTNYWVDVVFTPATIAPVIVGQSPASGAANIAANTAITATFNEAVVATSIVFTLTDSGNNPVATTFSYNSSTNTASWTPKAVLTAGATYTATVSNATDAGSNSLAAPVTWSFTVAPATGVSVFPITSTPGTITEQDPNAVELGMKFESSVAGTVTGVRFYKGPQNSGTHIGNLWSSTGQLLATATFSGESASGWQQVNFSTPVLIQANTIYIVSYHTNVGFYSADSNYFSSSVVDGPLTALSNAVAGGNGVYAYGSNSAFPTNTFQSSNYWVDVVFSPSAATIPAVIAQAPAANSTGVATNTTVAATFNESVTSSTIVFTLKDSGNNVVATTLSYNAATNTATWTPTAVLKTGTTYTATVTNAIDGNSNSMAAPVTWTFTTATAIVPTVTAQTPAANATNVSVATTVTATFNEAVTSSSIVFSLKDSSNNVVATTLSYNTTNNTATWTPTAALKAGTVYTATITTAVDAGNHSMAAPVTWSFTTAAVVTNTWTQSGSSGFSLGANAGTAASATGVQLTNELFDDFLGTTLSSTWSTITWTGHGGGPLADTVSGSTLSIKGGQALSTALALAPFTAVATFGAVANQSIGLTTGSLINTNDTGALFTTSSTTKLSAVVRINGTATTVSLGNTPSGSHTYSINPTSTGVQFLIDGVVKTTIAKVLSTSLKYSAVISQTSGTTSAPTLKVGSVTIGFPTTGTFTSSVFDSGKTSTWGLASWTATLPAGTSIQVLTRSGNTATPDGTWSAFQAVTNGGKVASPAGRYLQYEVIFVTTNQNASGTLQNISFQWS